MKALPVTQDLRTVAARVVWFREPEAALADPVHFLAHVMTYGAIEDLRVLDRAGVGLEEFRAVLEAAPPGVFDARSWAYWHARCGLGPAPPLPVRKGLEPVHPQP
jgi:hypothetical protein